MTCEPWVRGRQQAYLYAAAPRGQMNGWSTAEFDRWCASTVKRIRMDKQLGCYIDWITKSPTVGLTN